MYCAMRRRADEADGLDPIVGQQRVDSHLVAVHDVEDTRRHAGLDEQLGQMQRHGRVTLGRLEHERVAGGKGRTGLPQRDHGGEVERGDASNDAEWLAHRVHVDAGTGRRRVLALEQVRCAERELDDLDTALDVPARVGQGLAVFAGQLLGQHVHVTLDQAQERHQHAGPALGIPGSPLALGLFGVVDDRRDLLDAGQRNEGLHASRVGVEHVGESAGRASDVLAGDEVGQLGGHGTPGTWASDELVGHQNTSGRADSPMETASGPVSRS